jgi:hypothetical protein
VKNVSWVSNSERDARKSVSTYVHHEPDINRTRASMDDLGNVDMTRLFGPLLTNTVNENERKTRPPRGTKMAYAPKAVGLLVDLSNANRLVVVIRRHLACFGGCFNGACRSCSGQ